MRWKFKSEKVYSNTLYIWAMKRKKSMQEQNNTHRKLQFKNLSESEIQSSEEMELNNLMGRTKGGNYGGKLFDMPL